MPEPLSAAIVAGLATHAATKAVDLGVKTFAAQASRLPSICRLQKHFEADTHEQFRDVISGAAIVTFTNKHLPALVVQAFLEDSGNAAVLFACVVNPDEIEPDDLAVPSLARGTHARLLRKYRGEMIEAVRTERLKVFSAESQAALAAVGSLRQWLGDVILALAREMQAGFQSVTQGMEEQERQADERHEEQERRADERHEELLMAVQARPNVAGSQIAAADLGAATPQSASDEADEIKSLLDRHLTKQAIERAERAIATAEANPDAPHELRARLRVLAAQSYINTEDPNQQPLAAPHLLQAVEHTTDRTATLRHRALAALLQGKPAQAAEYASEAIPREPATLAPYRILAAALLEQGQPDRAVQTLIDAEKFVDAEDASARADLFSAQAWIAFRAKQYSDALRFAERALDADPDDLTSLTTAGAVAVFIQQERMQMGETAIDLDQRQALVTARDRLSRAIDQVPQEAAQILHDALHYRASTHIWLDAYDQALADLRQAHRAVPNAIETLDNLLRISVIGDPSATLNYAPAYLAAGGDEWRASRAVAHAYLALSDGAAAAREIETFLDSGPRPLGQRGEALELLVRTHDAQRKPSLADQALERLAADPGLGAYHQLAQAERFVRFGHPGQAIAPARAALAVMSSSSILRVRATFALAEALGKSERSDDLVEAADLFGQFVTSGVYDDAARSRMRLLHRGGPDHWGKALEACADAQREQRHERPTRIEADIYLRTGNFASAASRLEWLIDHASTDPQLLLALGRCYFRLGREREAYDHMRLAEGHVAGDAQALATAAEAYAHMGKHEDALRLSLRAIELDPADHQVASTFLSISLSTRSETITDPVLREQYIGASRDAVEAYPKRFPEGRMIQHIPLTNGEDETSLDGLRDHLAAQPVDEVDRLFRQKAPLGVLSQITGRDEVTTWLHATSHPEYGRRVSAADSEEIERQVAVAEKAIAVVVDLDACLALRAAGVLGPALKAFPAVYIPQASIDALTAAAHRKRRAAQEGETTVFLEEGELCRMETPPQVAQRFISEVEQLRRLLIEHPNARIIGATPGRASQLGPNTHPELADLFGMPTTEALFEASTRSLPLLAGDALYLEAFALVGVDTISAVAAVDHALKSGALSARAYHDAVISFVAHGYRPVPLGVQTLVRLATRSGFFLGQLERRVLASLGYAEWDSLSVWYVIIEFVSWLWGDRPGSAADFPTVLFKSAADGDARQKWTKQLEQILTARSSRDSRRRPMVN